MGQFVLILLNNLWQKAAPNEIIKIHTARGRSRPRIWRLLCQAGAGTAVTLGSPHKHAPGPTTWLTGRSNTAGRGGEVGGPIHLSAPQRWPLGTADIAGPSVWPMRQAVTHMCPRPDFYPRAQRLVFRTPEVCVPRTKFLRCAKNQTLRPNRLKNIFTESKCVVGAFKQLTTCSRKDNNRAPIGSVWRYGGR